MFKNTEVAKEVSALMLDIGARLDASLVLVQDKGSPEEFGRYKKVVASMMTEMLLEVMNPLYAAHPGLKPAQLN